MAQVTRSPKTYDVCVIGSGAGGGMAAKAIHFRARIRFSVVPLAHCGRAYQSLGAHRAAIRAGGFSIVHARLTRGGLAHRL